MDLSRSRFIERLSSALRSWPAGVAAFVALLFAIAYKVVTASQADFSSSSGFLELSGGRFPHYSAFTPSFIGSLLPWGVGGMVLAVAALRLSNAIFISRNNYSTTNADDESGSSAVEFVLVLPALAVLLLMILQIALLVQAKFVVNYAAFCAARSAIVVIPDDFSSGRPPERRNQIGNPETSEKVEIIHRAAALPLTAISPLPGFIVTRGVPFLPSVELIVDLGKLLPFDVSPSIMGQVMQRAPYAYHPKNTAVKVLTPQGAGAGQFKEHDWVTVRVEYRYYLAVPFAKKLFGTAYSENWFWTMVFGTDYYYTIVEQYTLPVDGEQMLPRI